jgi:hypothetical protein
MTYKPGNKPYLIVTAGPTGSGKSKVIDKTIEKMNFDRTHEKILIDDLVEKSEMYKTAVTEILKNVKEDCVANKPPCSEEIELEYYKNPSEDLLKQFSNAYFSARESGCTGNCNVMNDKLLKDAINNNSNIVLETTGTSIPTWLLQAPFIIPNTYTVVFAYSVVQLDALIERNKNRIIESMKKFNSDHNNPAPRLPNIEEAAFKPIVSKIKEVLLDLYKSCVRRGHTDNPDKCGKAPITRLLIFDNNGKEMTLAIDSMDADNYRPDFFTRRVSKLFGPTIGGGRIRVKRQGVSSRKSKRSKNRKSKNNKSRKSRTSRI